VLESNQAPSFFDVASLTQPVRFVSILTMRDSNGISGHWLTPTGFAPACLRRGQADLRRQCGPV